MGAAMLFRLRLSLIIIPLAAVVLFAQPARASSCLYLCGQAYLHTNNNSGYISYLATDLPSKWQWTANGEIFTTVNGTNGVAGGDHAVGVWYSSSGWTVFNEDITPISAQAQFNIFTPGGPYQDGNTAIYTHIATASNSTGDFTLLNNPDLNGQPNADVLVSAAYLPNHGVYDTHALGVWYDTSAQQWAIFHEDGSVIPNNAAYFVEGIASNTSASFMTISSTSNLLWGKVLINSPFTNSNPAATIQITQDWVGAYNPHNVGVEYIGKYWFIYNLDGSAIPTNVDFLTNVTG